MFWLEKYEWEKDIGRIGFVVLWYYWCDVDKEIDKMCEEWWIGSDLEEFGCKGGLLDW